LLETYISVSCAENFDCGRSSEQTLTVVKCVAFRVFVFEVRNQQHFCLFISVITRVHQG